MIQSLLDGKAPSQATSGSTSSDFTALKKKIIKKIEGNTMTLTGEPFWQKNKAFTGWFRDFGGGYIGDYRILLPSCTRV